MQTEEKCVRTTIVLRTDTLRSPPNQEPNQNKRRPFHLQVQVPAASAIAFSQRKTGTPLSSASTFLPSLPLGRHKRRHSHAHTHSLTVNTHHPISTYPPEVLPPHSASDTR
ncbi:uncharacterized protein BDZ83DRAFT_63484 [Colletotrichum acutatum]|uniref:Uncharacterized protein n=1 Tax=Glomerella acutata TaxID=27357 RepID=A0AAD8XBD4_GLOAC|nr:uncharacterized protein BDZ83DRAFT_63484 [Colletotrichum acutatum]KAK1714943.1 hypothetical protein BDZ83DRAFT_63484 [Colletotrichum acutatum]